MRSKVHPKYKTKYRVGHGSAYEQALVQRGDVTLGLSADATDAWRPSPSGRPGAPKTFSDCAIETAVTRRLVFRVPVRQAEGVWRSVLSLMGVDRAAPDHTTLSRRRQSLAVACRRIPSSGPIHRIVDSTGLSIVGEGEWAAVHHGGRGHRGWKTLHRAVDRGGVIVAHALTEPTVDDATMGIDLIATVADAIARVTADAAYETVACYAAAEMRDATGVVPPSKTARVSRRRPRGARARSHDHGRADARPAPLKAGGRLPAPGAGGECVLSVHIDSRGSAARPVPRRASGRVRGRVYRPEPDDRARSARVVQYWSVTGLWVGIGDGQFRVMHQRPGRGCRRGGRRAGCRGRGVPAAGSARSQWGVRWGESVPLTSSSALARAG